MSDLKISRPELAALLSVILSFSVAVIHALTQRWLPASDEALMELLIRDVPSKMPLVGVYSRMGWHHPGPAQLLLLALPYRLLGSVSSVLSAVMLLIHLGAITLVWLAARRIDRLTALILVVGMQLAALSVAATDLRMIWNPYVAILGLGALVVAAWSAAERQPIGAVALLPLGSLLVQSHLAAAPVATAVTIAAGAALFLRFPQSPKEADSPAPRIPLKAWGGGIVVTTALWIPPLVDQLSGSGNLGKIFANQGNQGPKVGTIGSFQALFDSYSLPAPWMHPLLGVQGLAAQHLRIPFLLLLPIAGLTVAIRKHDAPMVRGNAISLAAILGAILASAIMQSPLYEYLVIGQRGLAAVTVAIALGAILRGLPATVNRSLILGATSAVSLCLSGMFLITQAESSVPTPAYQSSLQEFTKAVTTDLAVHSVPLPPNTRVEVSSQVGIETMAAYPGLLLQLDRAGVTTSDGGSWMMPEGPRMNSQVEVQYAVVHPDVAEALNDLGWRTVATHRLQQPSRRSSGDQSQAEGSSLVVIAHDAD
ncbi:unannotated protein [freshwater metagenome]|uniref:Unannotated protein n=2 Tax=freshwater metagenome TaxID=449393 RepID=A0A6J7SF52_9ZZZZ|nr:hypothetical protein [Actinomycetota bacterium]MSV84632.1 hypothetical protein [Actinomycetota bacterium]